MSPPRPSACAGLPTASGARARRSLLELGPLEREELAALLAARADAPPRAELTDAIVARSEGNPFFAEELLAAAGDGRRAAARPARPAAAARVASSTAGRRACCGSPRPPGATSTTSCCARRPRCPSSTCASRCAAPSITACSSPTRRRRRFRFRHALLAEAIYATLLPGEREELHARLAAELARGEPPAAPAELAPHWEAAGRTAEALVASVEAAREAEAVFGLAEALAHLERALRLWPAVPDAAALAGLDLAELCSWAAERAVQTDAAPRAVELGRQPSRSSATTTRCAPRCCTSASATTCFERAAATPASPRSSARSSSCRRSRPRRSAHSAGGARACADAGLAPRGVAADLRAGPRARARGRRAAAEFRALAVLGVDLAYLGHGDEGLVHLRLALRLAEQSGDPEDSDRATAGSPTSLTMLGRPRESVRGGGRRAQVVAALRHRARTLVANQVEALIATGEWDEADRLGAAALRAEHARTGRTCAASTARELEVGRGDFDDARAHLEAAHATVREDERGSPSYDLVVTELALWERRWTDAETAVRDGLARARARDAALIRVQLCAQGLRAQAELAALARARREPTRPRRLGRARSCSSPLAAPPRRPPPSRRTPPAGARRPRPSTSARATGAT